MTQSFLDQAIEHACELLPNAGGDARALPEPMRTVVLVQAAQAIIDNGGLEYFFESDFPLNPSYSTFVDAFRRIGADTVARCIEVSVAMFPFPHPHLHEAQRRGWLVSIQDNEKHEFARFSHTACGDAAVWQKLSDFVISNHDAFDAAASGAN